MRKKFHSNILNIGYGALDGTPCYAYGSKPGVLI